MLKMLKNKIESNRQLFGPILFTMSGFFAVSMMILVKKMKHQFHMEPMVALFFRFLVVSCFMMPVMIKDRFRFFFGVPNFLNIIKDVLSVFSIIMWFQFGTKLAVNNTTTLSFLTPIFVVIIDSIINRSKIETYLWFSLSMCFVGVTFITGFDIKKIEMTYFIVIGVTFLRAVVTTLNKKVSAYQTPTQMLCSNALISVSVVGLMILFSGTKIPHITFDFIFQVSMVSVLFYSYYITYSYGIKISNITFLQPFDFLRIIFSAILSFIFLSETFAVNMIIGSCFVVFGVWYFLYSKNKKSKLAKS